MRVKIKAPLWVLGLILSSASVPARAAEPGSVFLDGGWRGAFLDREHRLGTGLGLGLAYGANESTELELRCNYDFLPSNAGMAGRGALEIKAGEIAAYFAPYRGDFRPMIGLHTGMVRIQQDELRWNLGMDAMALYDFKDIVQLYGTITPSVLLGGNSGEGSGEVWLRVGLGVRKRLGR